MRCGVTHGAGGGDQGQCGICWQQALGDVDEKPGAKPGFTLGYMAAQRGLTEVHRARSGGQSARLNNRAEGSVQGQVDVFPAGLKT